MSNKLVVDSSVAIKWFLPEIGSEAARRILESYQKGETALLAPDLLYAELGNIVWKKCRSQQLEVEEASEILDSLRLIEISTSAAFELMPKAFEIASRYQRTVYDSLYLALCEKESAPFVTADERLFNAVRSELRSVTLLEV